MRRLAIPLVVLTLVSLVLAGQASAFGWRRANCRRPGPAVYCASPAQAPALAASATASQTASAEMTESAALSELIGVMKGILIAEYDRLEQTRRMEEQLEEAVGSYGSD